MFLVSYTYNNRLAGLLAVTQNSYIKILKSADQPICIWFFADLTEVAPVVLPTDFSDIKLIVRHAVRCTSFVLNQALTKAAGFQVIVRMHQQGFYAI